MPLPTPPGVAVLRRHICELKSNLFLVGYRDGTTGEHVPIFPEPPAFTYLWNLWRSLLTNYPPPTEYSPPASGQETATTRSEMFQALDALQRRLEELFGPDPEPKDYCQGLPVEPPGKSSTTARDSEPAVSCAGSSPNPKPLGDATVSLLKVFTNGVFDSQIEKAARVLANDALTANEKLTRIDALIRFPATASAEQLGEMLGVSKQAVLKTDWWAEHRRGEKDDEIGRRRAGHSKRAAGAERPHTNDDEDR